MIRFSPGRFAAALLFVSALLTAPAAEAQIALSPRGSVSQTIDGTTIMIDYARPAVRGRAQMFGGPIWWGHIWTPGADWATTIEVNKDITLHGTPVPAGKYSIWMVNEPGDWEVILDPVWKQFHLPEPKKDGDEITFWVTPDTTAAFTETLTFDFPTHSNTGTTLRLRFDTREVTMDITVPSWLNLTVTEEEVAPYAGTYRTEVMAYDWTPNPFEYDLPMRFEEGQLVVGLKFNPNAPEFPTSILPLPNAEGIFHMAFLQAGEVVQTLEHMFEFLYDGDGNVTGFEARTDEDELWMRGTKQ